MGGHVIKGLCLAVLPFLPGMLLPLYGNRVSSTTILALAKNHSEKLVLMSVDFYCQAEMLLESMTASSPLSPHAF